jgi:hypothetical protein
MGGFAEVVFDQDRADRVALRLQMDRASPRQCGRDATKPLHRRGFRGTPGGTRTPNLLIRSQTQELGRPGRTKVLGRQNAIHQGLPVIHTKGWPRSIIGLKWHSEIPGCPTKNAFENKVIFTRHFSEK